MTLNLNQLKESCKSLSYSLENAMNQTEGCVWIKQPQLLGEGKKGSVYLVCKECENGERSCQFAVKYQKRNSSEEEFISSIRKEINIHRLISNLGLAPLITDAFICGDESYIITSKKDYNLESYMFKLLDIFNDIPIVLSILDNIKQSVLRMVRLLHDNKIVHGDLHMENIMIDVNPNHINEWKNPELIDFGFSKIVSSVEEANKIESISDIEMSFSLLISKLQDKYNQKLLNIPVYKKQAPDAPRKTKLRPTQEYTNTNRRIFSEDETPLKSSNKSLFDEDEDFITPAPSQNMFNKRLYEDSDDEELNTPVKKSAYKEKGLFDDEEEKQIDDEEEDSFLSKPKKGLFDDEDEEDNSFLSKPKKNLFEEENEDNESEEDTRYTPYESESYEDMIDEEYYIDGEYDEDGEYIQEIRDLE